MPWTLQQILDHADELADRFEAFDPSESDQIPVAEYVLQRAVRTRAMDEAQFIEAIREALNSGTSWTRIGEIVGVPGREVQLWYSRLAEPLEQSGPSLA